MFHDLPLFSFCLGAKHNPIDALVLGRTLCPGAFALHCPRQEGVRSPKDEEQILGVFEGFCEGQKKAFLFSWSLILTFGLAWPYYKRPFRL